jgi:hypothetical protein
MLKRGDVCIIIGQGSAGLVNVGVPVVILGPSHEEDYYVTHIMSEELPIQQEDGRFVSRTCTPSSRLIRIGSITNLKEEGRYE